MTEITIEQFQPGNAEQKAAFAALNREWLEKYFRVEPIDEAVFTDPEQHILAPGGVILLLRVDGAYAGCGSLLVHADGMIELAKMAVAPAFQGRGFGRDIAEALITLAEQRGAEKLYVVSNTKLAPAMRLYRALGFTDSPEDHHSHYERGNITMEKALAPAKEEAAA